MRSPAQSCVLSWVSYTAGTGLSNQALKTPKNEVSSNACLFLQRKLFLATQSEAPSFQLVPVVSHPPTMHCCEKSGCVSLITLRHWRAAIRSTLSLLFSR